MHFVVCYMCVEKGQARAGTLRHSTCLFSIVLSARSIGKGGQQWPRYQWPSHKMGVATIVAWSTKDSFYV